ncbi:hypothetical protein BH18ACT5_BH18ACT5_13040 [soil metagenome]
MQSQDYGPAKWSIAHRIGITDSALDQLFDEGQLLRTHFLRPTWHFVHPDDLRLLLALTGKRVHMINGFMYRQEGLDDTTRGRAEEVLAGTLEGHVHLTRTEIAAVLEKNGIVDERIAPAPQPSADDALQDFTLRYFASHGPATTRDFGWWTKPKVLRRGFHGVEP